MKFLPQPPKIIWITYTHIITLLQWENSMPLFISPKYLEFPAVLHGESAKSRETNKITLWDQAVSLLNADRINLFSLTPYQVTWLWFPAQNVF